MVFLQACIISEPPGVHRATGGTAGEYAFLTSPQDDAHIFQKCIMKMVFFFPCFKLTMHLPDTNWNSKLSIYLSQALKGKFLSPAGHFFTHVGSGSSI